MKLLIKAAGTAMFLIFALVFVLLVVLVVDEEDLDVPMEFNTSGVSNQVPEEFRSWVLKAASACEHSELAPGLLAAQLKQESGFSTSRSTVSPAGAQGPAQFMPATWPTWSRDDDGNGRADPFDVGDAVMAQGRMMCSLIGQAKSSGYSGDPRRLALAGYNAGWGAVQQYRGVPPYAETQNYVRIILESAKSFSSAPDVQLAGSGLPVDAVRKASGRLGTPYAWGGGDPAGPSTGFCSGGNGYRGGKCVASTTVGFDCSSLVQYAYWPALKLPRVAEEQHRATSANPVPRGDLQTGDLLFWRNATGIYHVAIYHKDGKVIHAPRTGKNVELVSADLAMPKRDYYAATRPAGR